MNKKTQGWEEVYKKNELKNIPWHTNWPDKNIVKLVNEGKIKKGFMLDMCSGDGTNSIYLASKGFEVVGIDISPTAVEIAKKRCLVRRVFCEYLVGDVIKTVVNRKFSFIFDRGCFHHLTKKDKTKYVKKLYNLLKDDGKIYVLCFSDKNKKDPKNLSKKDIERYFSRFNIIFVKDSFHVEPNGERRYFYSVFMEKKNELKGGK